MAVQAVLLVFLMMTAAVRTAGETGGVTFWRLNVTLTCPAKGQWFVNDKENGGDESETISLQYKDDGRYHCKYDDKTYQFYVEGKVCENCFELNANIFAVVITVDLMATVVVMMMVFKYTKKKDPAGPSKNSKTAAPPEGRTPPVPPSNYEPLNPRTRSQDTYSLVNRTG